MSDTNGGRWEFDQDGNVHYVPPEAQNTQDTTYRYSYHNTQNHTPRRNSKSNDTGWHWLFIILGFTIFWPIGLVLLFLELSGKWPGNSQVEQELRRAGSAAKAAAKQAKAQYDASQKAQTPPVQGKKAAKRAKRARRDEEGTAYGLGHIKLLRTIGGIMTAVFGFAFVMQLIDELQYFYSLGWLLEETVPMLALCLAGLALLGMAGSRKRKLKKFRKYLSMIGTQNEIFIPSLANAMGVSEKKATQDLEEMLERGFFENGYIDAARRCLILREGGVWDVPRPDPQPEDQAAQETFAASTLKRIRQLNDAIPDPVLTGKIDRIEAATAKIFRLLEERPEKAGELRSFMNYYLPETLKMLENYTKLSAQGVEGDNIAEAKQKIEGMMDKLVDGYEAQLDRLFANDVLDISADLKVMEDMLAKDGLAVDNELKF